MYGQIVYDNQLAEMGIIPYQHLHATSIPNQQEGHIMREFIVKRKEKRYGKEVTLIEKEGIFCPKCYLTVEKEVSGNEEAVKSTEKVVKTEPIDHSPIEN